MTKKKDLSQYHSEDTPSASGYKFGIITSKWNREITDALYEGCKKTLLENEASEENIKSVFVPGTFEIPAAIRLLAQSGKFDAIICLGCVIKGETKHNDYISHAVATAITQFSTMSGIPAIFGILTPDNWEQAKDRAGGKYGNKGIEAAVTAIEMADLKNRLGHKKSTIGFSS